MNSSSGTPAIVSNFRISAAEALAPAHKNGMTVNNIPISKFLVIRIAHSLAVKMAVNVNGQLPAFQWMPPLPACMAYR
jgi:hypothetical protein